MSEDNFTEERIRVKLQNFCDNSKQCGLEVFVVKKDFPKLKRISFFEKKNESGKDFRAILKEMLFEVLEEEYLGQESDYVDGHQLADNQQKYLIFEQNNSFYPFSFLTSTDEITNFTLEDLEDATGIVFQIKKEKDCVWMYQHLWSIMVPNKKKTGIMAQIFRFENRVVFSEQRESLLTIAKKIDILIMDNHLITKNIKLLQKYFGFQDYIYQSAQQTIQYIKGKNLVENTEKLTEYISRGKIKYAKKMMRIVSSEIFTLTKEQLLDKVKNLPRWKNKLNINPQTNQIVLNTYSEVESLIDLFDERYTRSDVTNVEYDTEVKKVVLPTGHV